jgi:hypothetical protein
MNLSHQGTSQNQCSPGSLLAIQWYQTKTNTLPIFITCAVTTFSSKGNYMFLEDLVNTTLLMIQTCKRHYIKVKYAEYHHSHKY